MAPGHIYFFDQHYPKESYTYTYTHTHCSLPNIHISRAFLPYVCMHVLHRCVPYTLICFLECREHTCINIHVALFHTYIYTLSHILARDTKSLSLSLSLPHTHTLSHKHFSPSHTHPYFCFWKTQLFTHLFVCNAPIFSHDYTQIQTRSLTHLHGYVHYLSSHTCKNVRTVSFLSCRGPNSFLLPSHSSQPPAKMPQRGMGRSLRMPPSLHVKQFRVIRSQHATCFCKNGHVSS